MAVMRAHVLFSVACTLVFACGKEVSPTPVAGDVMSSPDVSDPWGPSCVGEPRPDLPCPDELRGTKCVRAACPTNYYRLECVMDGVFSKWIGTTDPSLCKALADSGLEGGSGG